VKEKSDYNGIVHQLFIRLQKGYGTIQGKNSVCPPNLISNPRKLDLHKNHSKEYEKKKSV
jgi:hypothetical protein